jgi:hypothetical protein
MIRPSSAPLSSPSSSHRTFGAAVLFIATFFSPIPSSFSHREQRGSDHVADPGNAADGRHHGEWEQGCFGRITIYVLSIITLRARQLPKPLPALNVPNVNNVNNVPNKINLK